MDISNDCLFYEAFHRAGPKIAKMKFYLESTYGKEEVEDRWGVYFERDARNYLVGLAKKAGFDNPPEPI